MNKKYKSRYGADSDITAAQYLVEFIMERIAKKEKTTLPFKFWNIPRWNKVFRMQIKYANDILRDYAEEDVFAALRSKKGQHIFSLGAKKTMIVPLIEDGKRTKHVPPSTEKTEELLDDDMISGVIDLDSGNINKEKQLKNLWSKLQ